jgi:hypothetical protein
MSGRSQRSPEGPRDENDEIDGGCVPTPAEQSLSKKLGERGCCQPAHVSPE